MRESEEMVSLLYATVLNCKTQEDCAALFGDLCTYAEIIEETGISSATLSRVSKEFRHGRGGYAKFLPKN